MVSRKTKSQSISPQILMQVQFDCHERRLTETIPSERKVSAWHSQTGCPIHAHPKSSYKSRFHLNNHKVGIWRSERRNRREEKHTWHQDHFGAHWMIWCTPSQTSRSYAQPPRGQKSPGTWATNKRNDTKFPTRAIHRTVDQQIQTHLDVAISRQMMALQT